MHCPKHIESTVTRTAKVWQNDEGIMCLKFLAHNYDYADAKTDFTLLQTINSNPEYLIIDLKKLRFINKDGRKFLASHKLTRGYKKIAILRGRSWIGKLISPKKYHYFHPSTEMELFGNYEDALKWITKK